MRRAQIDGLTTPIRNLITNPEFETASGNGAIRTNLCTNPGFEGASTLMTVRSNQCINPRGVNAFADYQGASNQTITANVAITNHPDGITTANRVEYTSTSVNPGVTLLNPLTTGWQYTASVWVYHETSGGGTQGLAQAGVASGSAPAIATGVWTRVSWTFTASGTSHLGFRVSANSGAGSYLVTGVLVELRPDLQPFFDGATPTTTNLVKTVATPLTGVTNTAGVSYSGSTWTRSSVAAGTGVPNNRQYVALADLGAGGKIYTSAVTVANDQAFAQTITIDWCDTGFSTVTIQPGEIRRIVISSSRANYDSTYRFSDIAIHQSATEGRSILYKDWLIEEGTTRGDFYATTGDYTYTWNGTVNASISFQRAPGLVNWIQASNGTTFQSTTAPYNGSKCAAVVTKGTNGDGHYVADITVTAGTVYTFSAWIKLTSSVPSLSGVLRFKSDPTTIISDLGGTVHTSLVVGSWVRVSVSGTAPTGATRLQAMWRIYATHTPTTFYVDGNLIESHPAVMDYFDGSTVAAGDFNYNWTGTVNASSSEQRGSGLPGITAGNCQVIQSSEWCATGTKSLRIIPNTQYNTSSAIMLSGTQLARGKMYTAVATRRLTAPLTGTLSAYAGSIIFVHTNVGTYYSNFIVNSAGVGTARLKFFLADNGTTWTLRLGHGGTAGSGEVWWDNFMVVEGDYDGDFIDGTKPFSKWDGTSHSSTSVGYPAQPLNSIAGEPLVDLATAGTYILDDSFGPTEGRTFYTVYETLAENTGAVSPIVQYGDMVLNDTVPNTYIQLRQDNDGSANSSNMLFLRKTGAMGVSRTVATYRRHVVAWGIDDAGKLFISSDGGTRLTDSGSAMSLLHQKLVVVSNDSIHNHIRTIGFRGVHSVDTSNTLSRYLGNKYGAFVA